jgi:hypothetical protein
LTFMQVRTVPSDTAHSVSLRRFLQGRVGKLAIMLNTLA